jgi:glycosyltransferase involved in cell wall biosynthesis
MRKVKVLEVLESSAGGAGRHVSDLLLGLNLGRFETWFAFATGRADTLFLKELDAIKARGIRTVEVPMTRDISLNADARAFWLLYRLILREQFDVVHGHSSKAGFLGRVATKLASRRCKTVFTPHGIAVNIHSRYLWLEKLAGAFTDAMVAVSESEREQLAGYGLVPPDRIVTIYNGIRILKTETPSGAVRQRFNIPANAIVVGTCGRVAPAKDPSTFIHAATLVLRHNPNCFFLWIGIGEMLGWALAEVERLGIADRVRFIGYQSDVAPLLLCMDIFVLTSVYESFGYATGEAMALGRPVVGTDIAGTRDLVVRGVTGILVPPADPAALAVEIARLTVDTESRLRLGRNGQSRIFENFNCGDMVSNTEALYEKLVCSRAPKRISCPIEVSG